MKAWLGPSFCLLFLCPWLLGATECNLFAGSANKTSDAALMYTAQQQINAEDYTDALTTIGLISAASLGTHAGLALQASANAGMCGLNLVNIATSVQAMTSTTSFMQLMLTAMKSATSFTNCKTAEQEILSMVPAQMTTDDYVFLVFIEFAKVGAVLETSPASAADPTHSGTVSASFTPCVSTSSGITDASVGEIGVSFDLALSAITSSGLALASSLTTVLNKVCAPTGSIACTVTKASDFTALELLALRTLINTSDLGLGTCASTPDSYSNNACICP